LQLRLDVQLRPASSRGFSLVELMVVVTIIAVVSALVLPSMVQVIRERHTQQTAVSVLDIVRETRSRAMYRGTSHSLVLETVGASLRMHTYEGTSSSCRLSRFGGGTFDAAQRIYSLDLTTAAYTRDSIVAEVNTTARETYLQICFTPLGVTFFSRSPIPDGTAPAAVWSNDSSTLGTGSFSVDVFRVTSGTDLGVRRRVIIPLSGMPRMRS